MNKRGKESGLYTSKSLYQLNRKVRGVMRDSCRISCKAERLLVHGMAPSIKYQRQNKSSNTYRSPGARSRYSRSIKASILFLIIGGEGANRGFSCLVTSEIKLLFSIDFRSF